MDIDAVAIEAAKQRFRDRPNMHFVAADLCTRPFPADEFDEILFACTIHHLDDESLMSLLKEMHYCPKPDGVIHVFDLVRQDTAGVPETNAPFGPRKAHADSTANRLIDRIARTVPPR